MKSVIIKKFINFSKNMLNFPKNILVILSHASYFIPDDLKYNLNNYMKSNDNRLLKNFSDFYQSQDGK